MIPPAGIRRGATFVVEIEYSDTPEEVIDPDESSEGWVLTSDGAFVVNEPQAPYLATVTNGVFEMRVLRHGDMKLYQAVDPTLNPANWDQLGRESEIIGFFSDVYGAYPFSSGGGVVDNAFTFYALESQTKSMYDRNAGSSTVVHEIAHQWFGDAVR